MDNTTQKKCKKKFEKARLLTSQIRLRRIVGILGIGLPFVLAIASFVCMDAETVKKSISAYYHSDLQDVFVGILCVIGAFLFAYKGYDAWDDRASHLAGLSAVEVALFPTCSNNVAIAKMHVVSACVLFLMLSYISRYRFTRSDPKKEPTKAKKKRNQVYKWCAYVMIFGLIAIGAYKLPGLSADKFALCPVMSDNKVGYMLAVVLLLMLVLFLIRIYSVWRCCSKKVLVFQWLEKAKQNAVYKWCISTIFIFVAIGVGFWAKCCLPQYPLVFAIESVMLLAFGISWVVKGDTLWSDDDEKTPPVVTIEMVAATKIVKRRSKIATTRGTLAALA